MFIIKSNQGKYHFLNMCNLCRNAQFWKAQLVSTAYIHHMHIAAEQLYTVSNCHILILANSLTVPLEYIYHFILNGSI